MSECEACSTRHLLPPDAWQHCACIGVCVGKKQADLGSLRDAFDAPRRNAVGRAWHAQRHTRRRVTHQAR
eukprot:7381097-Prymnesium_polylepis.1